MKQIDTYHIPLSMADDPRLVEVFLPIRKRPWWERFNFWLVLIWAGTITWAGVVVILSLALGKHLLIWLRHL